MDNYNEKLFDNQTFDTIMKRLLDNHPNDYDKREGSVTWDIYAPFAVEERYLFIQMAWILKNIYGDTADREALIRLAKDRDIHIIPARQAIVEAVFNVEISSGEVFNADNVNYIVNENLESEDGLFHYDLICQQPGTIGNDYLGDITPVNNIKGLQKAEIIKILIPGEDVEETEAFRQRYFQSLRNKEYGFNIAEYVNTVNSIQGVGAVRCYPANPKPGQVRLVILDHEFKPPTKELVSDVQEKLDPVPYNQQGLGIVPIGHYVIVEGGKADDININLTIKISNSYNEDEIKVIIEKNIEDYLAELRTTFQTDFDPINSTEKASAVVRESFLETKILDINDDKTGAIIDVKVTSINGEDGNYTVKTDAVPVLGVINYE